MKMKKVLPFVFALACISTNAYGATLKFEKGFQAGATYQWLRGDNKSTGKMGFGVGFGGNFEIGKGAFRIRAYGDYLIYPAGDSQTVGHWDHGLFVGFLPTLYLGPVYIGAGGGFGLWLLKNSETTTDLFGLGSAVAGVQFTKNLFIEGRYLIDLTRTKPLERNMFFMNIGYMFR